MKKPWLLAVYALLLLATSAAVTVLISPVGPVIVASYVFLLSLAISLIARIFFTARISLVIFSGITVFLMANYLAGFSILNTVIIICLMVLSIILVK